MHSWFCLCSNDRSNNVSYCTFPFTDILFLNIHWAFTMYNNSSLLLTFTGSNLNPSLPKIPCPYSWHHSCSYTGGTTANCDWWQTDQLEYFCYTSENLRSPSSSMVFFSPLLLALLIPSSIMSGVFNISFSGAIYPHNSHLLGCRLISAAERSLSALMGTATNSLHPASARPLRQPSNFSCCLLSIPQQC